MTSGQVRIDVYNVLKRVKMISVGGYGLSLLREPYYYIWYVHVASMSSVS